MVYITRLEKELSMYDFKQVMGASSYKAWKEWEIGDYVVGKYSKEGEDKFGNPTYQLEVIEAGFEEKAPAVGAYFTLNSSGSLNKAFEDIEIGQVVKVIYKGEDTINKGKFAGKKYHSMEVLVAGKSALKPESEELI